MSIVNFNNTTPAAPGGNSNVTWQQSGDDISAYVPNSTTPLTTKGDVLGYSSVAARIPVGSDGEVLTADSTQPLGVKWASTGGGGGGGYLNILPFTYSAIGQGTWDWYFRSNDWASGFMENGSLANGDNISYTIWTEAGTYTVFALGLTVGDSGIMEIEIDGTSVASFDQYGSLTDNVQFTQTGVVISGGAHTVKVNCNGKNASSSGYHLRLQYLTLIRTA